MKVATRNNLLRKLSNSKWGANASTIRTTAFGIMLFYGRVCSTSLGSPYVISLSDFPYYVFGQEPVHLALWYVLLVCHQYDVCENSVGSVYVGGYGGLSESGLCVFCKLCPVCFLVVGKGPSVLL